MSSDFGYGVSKDPNQFSFEPNVPRTKSHVFGALRTFYMALFLKIKEEDFKDSNGNYQKTLYDDTMQYPLFEMSGSQHIEYVP